MDPIHEELHRSMRRPGFYPEATGAVEYAETHVSRLYFTGKHVYKVKKPVDFGFLNFTTLDLRRFFCQEEIRLNRRLCRGVYEKVVELRRGDEGLALEGPGETVEVAVRMKRLPAERMLDSLLEREGVDLESWMPRIARRLSRFHRQAQVSRLEDGSDQAEIVARNWRENFSQTETAVGDTLSRQAWSLLRDRVEAFLEGNRSLLTERQAEGWVRDGHGDLHADHICLTEPICIYDCIEFNRRFRVADVLADLAFLLMDLEFHGRRDLANRLERTYFECWDALRGEGELLGFYRLYRAFVRGKVEGFLALDAETEEETRRKAAARATGHFNLALGYLCPPLLVLTCGLMGVGKSTVAAGLARFVDARLLRSDVVRKELAGLSPDHRSSAEFGEGLYTRAMTDRTYEELRDRAARALAEGRSVIVDASFARRAERDRFRQLAREQGVPLLTVFLVCDPETARKRIAGRLTLTDDPSDARPELLDRQRAGFEEPRPGEPHLRVDTCRGVDYNVHLILCRMAEPSGVS